MHMQWTMKKCTFQMENCTFHSEKPASNDVTQHILRCRKQACFAQREAKLWPTKAAMHS